MLGYLDGALEDLEERARFLKSKIKPGLARCNATLMKICRERLDAAAAEARVLRGDPEWLRPAVAASRFRAFRKLVSELDELEYTAVQVLLRWKDEEDGRANQLVDRIASEIRFPLPTPVVACQSREYYRYLPDLDLLLIPPAEGAFLLHLPDLYHELAHPLLLEDNNPNVEPLHQAFMNLWSEAQTHIHGELERENRRRRTPDAFRFYLDGWRKSWRSWLTEFICDAFAAHTLGPAYAWAHFHLTAKRGADPYQVPLAATSSHPADAARLEAVLAILIATGWSNEACAIRRKWNAMVDLGGFRSTPEYERCFPLKILESIASTSSAALAQMGCPASDSTQSTTVGAALNQAWDTFWFDPSSYAKWQRHQAVTLDLQPSISHVL